MLAQVRVQTAFSMNAQDPQIPLPSTPSCDNVGNGPFVPMRASDQSMTDERQKSWLRGRLEAALVHGLTRAYETVKVDPARYLLQLRAAYNLPIASFRGVYRVEIGYLDEVAESVIRSSTKIAALQGAGFGLGGILTLVPDMGILSAITMRAIQKLSLLYGFEFNTEEEMAELWIAAASAAGVDISRELLEKEVVNRFVPKVIQRIAVKASGEVVEKWAGRLIPVASSLIGAGLNYYFVRTWGERARAHFRLKHLEIRKRMSADPALSATNATQELSSRS
jgi:EcsC protein family